MHRRQKEAVVVAVVRGGDDDGGFNGVLVGWLGFACTKMGTPIKMI